MPYNREIIASVSFEPEYDSTTESEAKESNERGPPKQNEATLNLIRCMKWALAQSITSISHPARQRPINPKKDFAIKTRIDVGSGRGGRFSMPSCTTKPMVKQPNSRTTFTSRDGNDQTLDTDESDVGSNDDMDAPPASLTFVDYSPMCYRHIREFFNIDHGAYCDVLLHSRWHSTPTPGKSAAQLFFCGKDWVIKTMTPEESKFLRRILHRYYFFVLDNPHTLLPHFVGHHSLTTNGEKMYIVIMQNVFATENTIHEKYDLKGSTVGRFATEAEKMKQTCTQKDLDINRPIHVGVARRNLLIEQIKRDCGFLKRCSIMDYSFLVGIHVLPVYESIRLGACTSHVSPPSAGEGLGVGYTTDKAATQVPISGTAMLGAENLDGLCFTADKGGMMSADHPGVRREIYYVGIIDILQEYNARKRLETLIFGFLEDRKKISAVPPKEYAARFVSFVSSIIV
ncbi:putative phosphatidylinositol 4-phosphate 5-kinase alpha [Trypanosoma vivax]|nr:putative phosphatidylinositol 4-phosphate 5-kinase alpha [Trypanosoma vivax]